MRPCKPQSDATSRHHESCERRRQQSSLRSQNSCNLASSGGAGRSTRVSRSPRMLKVPRLSQSCNARCDRHKASCPASGGAQCGRRVQGGSIGHAGCGGTMPAHRRREQPLIVRRAEQRARRHASPLAVALLPRSLRILSAFASVTFPSRPQSAPIQRDLIIGLVRGSLPCCQSPPWKFFPRRSRGAHSLAPEIHFHSGITRRPCQSDTITPTAIPTGGPTPPRRAALAAPTTSLAARLHLHRVASPPQSRASRRPCC